MSVVARERAVAPVTLYACVERPELGLIPEDELSTCGRCEDDPHPDCPDCEGLGLVVGYPDDGYALYGRVLRAVAVAVQIEESSANTYPPAKARV